MTTEDKTLKSSPTKKTFFVAISSGIISGFLFLQTQTNIPFSDIIDNNPILYFMAILMGVLSVQCFLHTE